MNGETIVAPALAASRACPAENTSVQFVFMPLSVNHLMALMPSFSAHGAVYYLTDGHIVPDDIVMAADAFFGHQ
jgi:hypothetical protein